MLLLPRHPTAMQVSDLRPHELAMIEKWKNPLKDFILVYRDGFVSLMAFAVRKSYGVHRTKTGRLYVKEVFRYSPKGNLRFIGDYFYHTYLGGWQTVFTDFDLKQKGYRYTTPPKTIPYEERPMNDYVYAVKPENYMQGEWGGPSFHCAETRESVCDWVRKNVYKYFGCSDDGIKYFAPWNYIDTFKANLPASELFFKQGNIKFGLSKKMCHLKPKEAKAVLRWIREHGEHYNITELLGAVKRNCTVDEFNREKQCRKIAKAFAFYQVDVNPERASRDIWDYLMAGKKKGECLDFDHRLRHYIDYINDCNGLGKDMSSRGVWFPRDLEAKYAEIRKEIAFNRLKAKADPLAKRMASLLAPLVLDCGDGFSLAVLQTPEDFRYVGDALSICVGGYGYIEKQIDGTSLIIGLWKDGKPVNCIELECPNGKHPDTYTVLQNRGEHNRDSQYQREAKRFVRRYIAAANKSLEVSHATA